MSRKMAREITMKAAYADLLGGAHTYAGILDLTDVDAPPEEEDILFYNSLLEGMRERRAELDDWITKCAIGWTRDRMPKVDLCVLRIALYEMLYREDITHSVSINEAVELAKRFCGDKSPAFINGILGAVDKQLNAGREKDAQV